MEIRIKGDSKRKKRKREFSIKVAIITIGIIPTLLFNSIAYAENSDFLNSGTIDDLRELLGQDRIDGTYSEQEQKEIINGYSEVEYHNNLAKTFEILRGVDIYSEVEELNSHLSLEIENISEEIEKSFRSGEQIEKILEMKTKLDTLTYEKDSLKEKNDELVIEKKTNEWEGDYLTLMDIFKEIESMKELGRVGIDMKPPIDGPLYITSLYGTRKHPSGEELEFHSGLDLRASLGDNVYSQWAGTVNKVYESESGGKTIEITHGEHVETRYLHLSKINVEVGQEVKQRELIGKAGDSGKSATTPHLHLEVSVDGMSIDPIILFGENGANALYQYLTRDKNLSPEKMEEIQNEIRAIKDRPKNFREQLIQESRDKYKIGERPVDYTKDRDESGEEIKNKESVEEPLKKWWEEKVEEENTMKIEIKEGHESPSPNSKILLPRR